MQLLRPFVLASVNFSRQLYRNSWELIVLAVCFSCAIFQSCDLYAQTADPLKQHYEAAAQFARTGDRIDAAAEYKAFLAEALHRIANGRAGIGEFTAAEAQFEQASALAPGDANLKFDFAKVCLDADDLPKARHLTDELVLASGASLDVQLLHARVLFHLGEFKSAQSELEKIFSQKAEFNVGYLLAKTYLLLRQEQQAKRLFETMAQKFGDTAQTHMFFGRAYSETDYKDEAIAEFHKAMGKDDRAPDVHYYLALTYLGHNEAAGYQQAIPEFRAELERNPADYRSHYMLGYIAAKQRDFAKAQEELQQALKIFPDDLQSMLQLADIYENLDKTAEAESLLRKAIGESSSGSENQGQVGRAHYLLGRLLEKTGRREDAAKEMAIVAEIQKRLGPSSMQTNDSRTKEAQDESRRALGTQPQQKLQQLEAFISGLRPAMADAYNNLGVITAGDRDFVTATKYFENASDWDPTLEGIDANLGRAAYFAGAYNKAADVFAKHLQAHPDDNSARAMLGLAWFKLDQYQKVVDVLGPIAAAIQGNPDLANAYNVSLSKIHKN